MRYKRRTNLQLLIPQQRDHQERENCCMKLLVRRDENDDILYQASRFVRVSLHDVVPLVFTSSNCYRDNDLLLAAFLCGYG